MESAVNTDRVGLRHNPAHNNGKNFIFLVALSHRLVGTTQ
jgi:hypothetical protein